MSEPRIKGRSRCGRVSAVLVLSLALLNTWTRAWGAELYGLVIGIDDYLGTANDLEGAVNDARDVAQSLDHLGAREVVGLFNDDARKDRIVSEWERLVGKAKAGDTIHRPQLCRTWRA
jgi:Caspase domain